MMEFLSQPWPWYVTGPLIGLIVPALLLVGGKQFGISSNLRHLCAATFPGDNAYFQYDWRVGLWNLTLVLGVLIGGILAGTVLAPAEPIALSQTTQQDLSVLGIVEFNGLAPDALFSFSGLFSWPGFVLVVIGGFLVGFGARYAGGCTSGHAITGLSDFQLPSLIAVIGFFVGGLLATHLLLPLLL